MNVTWGRITVMTMLIVSTLWDLSHVLVSQDSQETELHVKVNYKLSWFYAQVTKIELPLIFPLQSFIRQPPGISCGLSIKSNAIVYSEIWRVKWMRNLI